MFFSQNTQLFFLNFVSLTSFLRVCKPYKANIGCPTSYQTRQFFNNSKTNEDIATRFEQEYVRCVRNEKECVCSKIMSVCV